MNTKPVQEGPWSKFGDSLEESSFFQILQSLLEIAEGKKPIDEWNEHSYNLWRAAFKANQSSLQHRDREILGLIEEERLHDGETGTLKDLVIASRLSARIKEQQYETIIME